MEISRLQGLEPLPGIIGTPNWENPQIESGSRPDPLLSAVLDRRFILVHNPQAQVDVGNLRRPPVRRRFRTLRGSLSCDS